MAVTSAGAGGGIRWRMVCARCLSPAYVKGDVGGEARAACATCRHDETVDEAYGNADFSLRAKVSGARLGEHARSSTRLGHRWIMEVIEVE